MGGREMASALVDKALEDIELLLEYFGVYNYPLKLLQLSLRSLRTFILCARKWQNESDENTSCSSGIGSLGTLLSRLEDALVENGKAFHNHCVRETDGDGSCYMSPGMHVEVFQFVECIESFHQEIAESYITLSEYSCSLQSNFSMEFIDSLLVSMEDIRDKFFYEEKDPVEALKEKLVFFKNFIRFGELRGFGPWQLQVLFIHLHVVAVNVARLCHEWIFNLSEDDKEDEDDDGDTDDNDDEKMLCDKFQLKFSELQQKIKPVDPPLCEAYVQILTALIFSRSSHALTVEKDKLVLGDFIDSLLCNIVEALKYNDSYMLSLKDQGLSLYEGLRFLRTILTKHLEKIDELHEKVKDLIGAAVNKAAIVICPLLVNELKEGLAKEMDFALCSLLEMIKLIKVVTSAFIFPKTDVLGFMDFFLENLKELPTCKIDSIALSKDQIQTVQEDLIYLRSFLENIRDQHNHDGTLQRLWTQLVDVVYETQFIILSLVVGDNPDCSPLEFKAVTQEIHLIKKEALKIGGNNYSSEAQKAKTSNPSESQGSTPGVNKIVLTLDDEANAIIEQLITGSKQLDIISIVGMPGLGKTTLARSIYDLPSVRDLFHTHAWCVVSQVYKKKDLLLRILGFVDPEFSDEYSKENEYTLEERLKQCLLRKRYLIVLDDVWEVEAWSVLEKSFPNDANSSRILLTSRHADVAKKINANREPHRLRQLTDDESWELLQKKLSCKESYPINVGRRIAKNCKGLPLTVVILAGILANLESDGWEEIAGRLSLSALSVTDQCMHTLELSYKKLPDYLKSCLLYFGAFPEDTEIHFGLLTRFWIAEGFVKKCESISLEDVAKDYINDLIGRGLVMASEERSIGGIKKCRMHDLLREFCAVQAKREKFMSFLSGHDELFTFHGQRDLQRLCVHSTREHFEKSRLFSPGVRSLILFSDDGNYIHQSRISFILHLFKHLKVLSLPDINLGSTFPREMTSLVELKLLAVYGVFNSIPSEIAKLLNLETLCVNASEALLPDTIWNMLKLRTLYSSTRGILDSGSVKEKLEKSSDLNNLDTFSTLKLSFRQSMEKILRKLPNIRRLKCRLFESGESNADSSRIVTMDFLSRLESLHLILPETKKDHIAFHFPLNLKKLTLSNFYSSTIPKSGELPNLLVLKLLGIDFEGNVWDMKEKWKFPKLKLLELTSLRIVRWTGSDGDDHFPCLEKLVLRNCWELKEIPSCLRDVTSLQMIEVRRCAKSVVNLLLKIKEEQENNWGNVNLQMLTSDV
ncbi:hypothetical protein ACH5RR_009564 [Cinchona calisaya]|uniref:Late blight resistance protein homolog R1A-3 n=1 Tax=Cinchona calisaya TaxID=153742 RepID=A0ABD3AHA3_9GENT